jgi:hypothetical protein
MDGLYGNDNGHVQDIGKDNRNALRGTDLLGPLVTGLDGFADNEIKDVHEGWCPVDGSR